jgi:hypothetical protein
MSIDLRNPTPPLQRIVSSSASVTAYGHPRRLATTRMARSLYPARPAWQNGAGSWIGPIRINCKIKEHRTSNIEHRMLNHVVQLSMFSVECSMFTFFLFFNV